MSIIQQKARQQVSNWLLAGVIMIIVQILLGGITRLTGSGLSITEWKPLIANNIIAFYLLCILRMHIL